MAEWLVTMLEVLIAEADPSTVFVAKRILTRDLGCGTCEADNGLDALHEASRRRLAAVLIGLDLPGLPALEVVQALRQCPDTQGVPIVTLTGDKSESLIRRVAAQHVRHCLVKPIDVPRFTALVRELINAHRPTDLGSGILQDGIPDGATLLIADGDSDFRHFFQGTFGSRFRVVAASSGAEAMKLAQGLQPPVILAGERLGPVDRSMLVRMLRSARIPHPPVVLAIADRGRLAELRQTGLFHGVVSRTFVPGTCREQFEAVVGRPSSLPRLLTQAPGLRGYILSAVEQSCGMLVGIDAEPVQEWRPTGEPQFTAAVDMAVRVETDVIGLRCTLAAAAPAGAFLAERMLGTPAAEVTGEDIGSVLGELANIVTGRVQNSLQEQSLPTKCGLPQIAAAAEPRKPAPRALHTAFRLCDESPLELTVEVSGTAAPDARLAEALAPPAPATR